LNNGMGDCSIPGTPNVFGFLPSTYNFIQPGKRCMSSSTPMIVENTDHSFFVALGSAGGSKIITTTVQCLLHILDRGATMMEAIREPRWHDQLSPDVMLFEYSYDNRTTNEMRKRGHNVAWMREGLSAAQGIKRSPSGMFEAAGEPRQANSAGLVM
jgi:gamma-glutamyltranspeptidase/glutathione hydrolase